MKFIDLIKTLLKSQKPKYKASGRCYCCHEKSLEVSRII